jgi:UDP-glucuronate decarboxylase
MDKVNLKKREKIAIIGHRGFIGTHLTSYFSDKQIPYITFNGDLLQNEDVESFFKNHNVNTAVFLVGRFLPPFEELVKTNLLALQNFLEIGTKSGLSKIIFTSTGAVYGEPLKDSSFEDDPLSPNTLYGLSKMYAEECIRYYNTSSKLKYVILRFPNVYGEHNNKGVIFNFLNGIKNNEKITITGSGEETRNFLHVSDACSAIEKALYFERSEIFNISNPENVSINELVGLLKTKYSFDIEYTEGTNSLKSLSLNIDKAKKLLNFESTVKEIKLPENI